MTKLKRIPKFATEAAKPTTTPISIRLPETLLLEFKRLANERDVPYQSLMKPAAK